MNRQLHWAQWIVLGLAAVPMIAVGAGGAIGTYANARSQLGNSQTALGVVAAGEGATLVAALVMLGLTMLGQGSPLAIRAALWLLPAAASVLGIVIAPTLREAVVFGITPLAMTVSAEGLGLLARRIVVHQTGVDVEAQRRNAATLQRLAYHRARAQSHPTRVVRWTSERTAWRLAARVGHGDAELGADLVVVQRARLAEGADAALAGMLGTATPPAALPPVLDAPEKPVPAPDSPLLSRPDTTVPLSRPAGQPRDSIPARAATTPTPDTGQDTRRDIGHRRSTPVVPASVPPERTTPSVRDTIYDALLSGADPEDRDSLRARAREVHGEIKADTFRKSLARAVRDYQDEKREGFYP